MRMRFTVMLVGLTSLFVSLPSQASASHWTVQVDNSANPTPNSQWASNDSIYVEVCGWWDYGDGYEQECTTVKQIPAYLVGLLGAEWWNVLWWDHVDYVHIWTGGSDMFGIDQVKLIDNDAGGVVRRTWGADNSQAYCLSTDPNDHWTNPAYTCSATPDDSLYFFTGWW